MRVANRVPHQVEIKQTGGKMKHKLCSHGFAVLIAIAIGNLMSAMSALAAVSLNGQVLAGGGPVANSTVTLWEASNGAPKQIAQTKTNGDGRFQVRSSGAHDAILYVIAAG